jgi:Carboxypeptidase regulatory-like domain/TonB dependent receptor
VRMMLVALFLLLSNCCVFAQSPNGSIRGIVLDSDAKSIAGAEVIVVNDATGVKYVTSTNAEGLYAVENLPPGPYRIQVSKFGFKGIIKPDLIVNVQDALSLNFTLPIGASNVTVTVEGGSPMINTTDASVSTVVDRNFVENMPLNGRSFQDLILLTPGVVTNNATAGAASPGQSGEFSVNGQRTESNYYTVDGASANVGTIAGVVSAPSNSGSLPVSTVLGTTQGLVSVDALQEFRVQTSTYSAEYGRSPGGQFSFVTRSGTNQWHGTAFDYLRNNYFDANDWFNNYQRLSLPALRQNDFGVTLGGPLEIPGLFKKTDETFFFFSYEGLRLLQPQEATVSYVPTSGLRGSTPSPLQPALNVFPLPSCPSSTTNCATDLGNGLGEFVGTWSNPSSINSYSVRLDRNLARDLMLFFRFSDTSSNLVSRLGGAYNDPANPVSRSFSTRTYTLGVTSPFTTGFSNEFRLNYSTNTSFSVSHLDNFAGAEPADLTQLQNLSGPDSALFIGLFFSDFANPAGAVQQQQEGRQKQWNLVDTAAFAVGAHQLKLGVDYRRLAPTQNPLDPYVEYDYYGSGSVQSNSADSAFAFADAVASPRYLNFSAFAQDQWRMSSRLNLSLGLRWELNPAPGAAKGNLPYTVVGSINDPGSLALAPAGTALWKTTFGNFAPRFGVAYLVRNNPRFETVLRGGFGVFYDTGQQQGSAGYQGPGYSSNVIGLSGAAFPLPVTEIVPPIQNPPVPPYSTVYAFYPHLQLPFTLQWNASLQQSLGNSQSLTISYLGANGRRLLQNKEVNAGSFNPNFGIISYYSNGLTSDYDALQVQFQRRLSQGLQVLGSYTWAHSIDYGSRDAALPYVRGNSDFDIRQSFSSAVSYVLPNVLHNSLASVLLHHWAVDDRFTARSGFPVTLNGRGLTDPATGKLYNAGLNLVPGEPIYLYGPAFPGGRSINPAAFSQPPRGTFGDAPRNFVRGFGAWQMDLAVRREFPIGEKLKLQFRTEAFNLFNHPNFGSINSFYCPPGPFCTFGQATSSLAQSLGVLSPLYQMGGPRSVQLALKLLF